MDHPWPSHPSCQVPYWSLFPSLCRMVEYSLDLQNINLSAIRTVRVLRPLKAINRVPSESACSAPHSWPTQLTPHSFTQKRLTNTFKCLFRAWGSLWQPTNVGLLPWSSWPSIWEEDAGDGPDASELPKNSDRNMLGSLAFQGQKVPWRTVHRLPGWERVKRRCLA